MKNSFKMTMSFLFLSIAFSSVDYQSQIQPIFDANCMGCHAGGYSGGLMLGSYDEVMEGGNSGNTVVAGDHAASSLWVRIENGSMPPSGALSIEDINLIAQWIDEGALAEPASETNPSPIFMTELTDPQNSSDAGRYVELFNSSDANIDLSTGWAIQRWTNGNADPQSATALTGIIPANGFYVICNNADNFSATYGMTCSQNIGTGGAADSNGDDNIALLDSDGNIVDMFGVAGEDGSGTGHEFEDGRAERAITVTSGNPVWDESEWNVDNDSGGGDGNQYAPEGYDPFAWIGNSGGADDVLGCTDDTACNYDSEATIDDGSCLYNDCNGECGGDAIVDECGECGGDGSACTYSVTFNVNMNYQDVDSENGVRLFGLGSWSSDDASSMTDDNGDGIYSTTVNLAAGDYEFKFRNGWSYEDVDELECAVLVGDYWNRSLSVVDSDITLDVSCFGACDDCLPGCMDPNASNYNSEANTDDDSCDYPAVEPDNIFFSEYGEGSSYNKYLEIYNASDEAVDLSAYQRVNCSNGCTEWEYYTDFAEGASVAGGDVYVICDSGVGDDFPSAECDESGALYFNGDDAQGIYHIASGTTIDLIGEIGDDPGSGWDVAGESAGTKDHSIIRKSSVITGNTDWAVSAGTNSEDSEWVVQDQNTWAFIGSHPHDFASACDDDTACNFGEEGDCTYAEVGFDCDGNALIDVTFHVNMAEQVVDTEGYGLDLFMPSPYGYHDMTDDDGDGVWSVTLTLLANTDYSYKFKNGESWEANFNDLGCGDGSDYGNRYFTSGSENMDVGPFCFSSCTDCVPEVVCGTGDANGDLSVDVTDIVLVVQGILGEITLDEVQNCGADVTGDGVVNVTDIVNIVYIILGSGMDNFSFADEITISKNLNELKLNSNGVVGAIQITISHDKNAKLNITDNSYFSMFKTNENKTTIILVSPEDGQLVSMDSEFEILDMMASDLEGEIKVIIVDEFNLLSNYPNPFNPVTTISYSNSQAGFVKVNIYDLNGRLVNTLVSQNMDAGQYKIDWNGDDNDGFDVTSGVYLLTLENSTGITTSKITLLR